MTKSAHPERESQNRHDAAALDGED